MKFNRYDAKEYLIELMRQFICRQLDASAFVHEYQKAWRVWRDSDMRKLFNDKEIIGAFNRAFTVADCYKEPTITFRMPCDIDDAQLIDEISKILAEVGNS